MVSADVTVTVKTPCTTALINAFRHGHPAITKMFSRWLHEYASYIQERFLAASRGDGTWPPLAASTIYARSRQPMARFRVAYGHHVDTRGVDPKTGQRLTREKYLRLEASAYARQRSWTKAMYGSTGGYKIRGGGPTRGPGAASPVVGNVSILVDTGTLRNSLTIGQVGNVNRQHGLTAEYGIGGVAAHPKGLLTIGKLAAYHQNGGTIPGRPPQREILAMPPAEVMAKLHQHAVTALREVTRG